MSLSLNPLANPRGTKLVCEICQKSAFSQCTHCRVTFYCGRDHQAEDWDSIHSKVCSLLAAIRTPKPFLNSSEQRRQYEDKQASKQRQLVELTSTEAQRLLYDGQYVRALPAAQLSLRSATELYGAGTMELIPALVVLAEACIGASQLAKAEQYLSQAKWSALQVGTECPAHLQSQVNRVLGRLNIVRGNHIQAMVHLAEDVYYSSVAYGPEHIRTSGGYFNMARSFLTVNNVPAALSLYVEVLSIWHTFIRQFSVEDQFPATQPVPVGQTELVGYAGPGFAALEQELDEAQRAEAVFVFEDILHTLRTGRVNFTAPQQCQCHHTFSVLSLLVGKKEKATEHCRLALSLCGKQDDEEQFEDLSRLNRLLGSSHAQTRTRPSQSMTPEN